MHDDYLADDYTPSRTSKRKKRANIWNLIKFPVYAAAGLVGIWLLFRSFGIYTHAFTIWGLPLTGTTCGQFDIIPLVGGWVGGGCHNLAKIIIGTVALLSLVALTILMSIPVFVSFHPSAIADMVDQLRHNRKAHQKLSAEAGDTEEVHTLIQRHNDLPDKALRTLYVMSLLAFFAEMFIVWTARGGHASVMTCLIDSLGFEALLVAVLSFRMVFIPKPKTTAREI